MPVVDGTPLDCIVIPIVAIISLAAWLLAVMLADAHPAKTEPRPPATPPQSAVVEVPGQAAPPAVEADRVAPANAAPAGAGRAPG